MSEQLRQLYEQKHRDCPNYGASAKAHIPKVKELIVQRKWNSMLDFGCGKAVLSKEIPGITNYDFAIPEYSTLPDGTFDAAFCIDVLEHIPEDELPEVLQYLATHAKSVYFCIHTGESIHKLANGEPCHCTVRSADWWLDILCHYWKRIEIVSLGGIHFTTVASDTIDCKV